MTQWTGAALRRAALAALGPLGDARAREALVHGGIIVRPEVARWQASHGPVEGVAVTLLLDDSRFERAVAPAVEDALRAAVAAAVATRAGESLFDFAIERGDPGDPAETPYRGRGPT